METGLLDLPPELLSQIVSHFESARLLYRFSLVCKSLQRFVEEDGWRIFVHANFPSIRAPPYWNDAARTLTTISRAWDRRSFVARFLLHTDDVLRLPHGRPASPPLSVRPYDRARGSQSMGYQPVIDCAEELTGSDWHSRRELLALGTGATLKLRLKYTGNGKASSPPELADCDLEDTSGDSPQKIQWITWKEEEFKDGPDDITSVNILKQSERRLEADHMIVGRASGKLQQVAISSQNVTTSQYETAGRPVRSATVSPSNYPLLAACLSEGTVALYDAQISAKNLLPLTEISVLETSKASRIWTSRFLSSDTLAIGRGPSKSPITVHDVAREGSSTKPIRNFGAALNLTSTDSATSAGESSVYSLAPLPSSVTSGSINSSLFLSGWYSGEVRLHDLRSSRDVVSYFSDPVDPSSAVYSLLTVGTERFIAGGARHSQIKVFDTRMPGARRYFAINAEPCRKAGLSGLSLAPIEKDSCCDYHRNARRKLRGFNLFLVNTSCSRPRGLSRSIVMNSQSPVYALGSTSAFSSTIYAGMENSVVQIDLVSAMDRHPDFGFAPKPITHKHQQSGDTASWLDPKEDALSLGLVEHSEGNIELKAQKSVAAYSAPQFDWLDYRWFVEKGTRDGAWSRGARSNGGISGRRR